MAYVTTFAKKLLRGITQAVIFTLLALPACLILAFFGRSSSGPTRTRPPRWVYGYEITQDHLVRAQKEGHNPVPEDDSELDLIEIMTRALRTDGGYATIHPATTGQPDGIPAVAFLSASFLNDDGIYGGGKVKDRAVKLKRFLGVSEDPTTLKWGLA